MIIENSYISYVNLDHRTDRLKHMKEMMARVGLNAVRTRGMLPEEVVRNGLASPDRLRVMQNRTPGAIGCHFSQVSIMKEALARGQHAFVMEDDLVFCKDFKERMKIVDVFFNQRSWDVLWLGGTVHISPPWWHKTTLGRDFDLTDNPRMIRTYGAFSTHAYIVNVASIPMVLKGLDDILHLSMGIDWAFIQMEPNMQTFMFVPGCVIQYDNTSDIGRGVTTFSGFKKLGAHWYAERMEDFDPETYDWSVRLK